MCHKAEAIPVIRCIKSGAAEMIARKLDSRLRDHLKEIGQQNVANARYNRPCLVIVDRSLDITTMLQHSWTYRALVADVLGLKMNQVTVQVITLLYLKCYNRLD